MLITIIFVDFSHQIMELILLANHMKDRVILIYIGGFYKFMKESACKSNLMGTKDKDPNPDCMDVIQHIYVELSHVCQQKTKFLIHSLYHIFNSSYTPNTIFNVPYYLNLHNAISFAYGGSFLPRKVINICNVQTTNLIFVNRIQDIQ